MTEIRWNGHHAATIGNFNPPTTIPLPPRLEAYCPCGARLSRYRPPQTTLCWACEAEKLAQANVIDLHPSPHDCVDCGAPIWRGATHCQTCHRTHQ